MCFYCQVSSPGVGPGVGVGVELVSRGQQDPFRGFLLQARDVTTDQAVGFFTLAPNTQAKYLSCSNNRQVCTIHYTVPPAEIFKLPVMLNILGTVYYLKTVPIYCSIYTFINGPFLEVIKYGINQLCKFTLVLLFLL